MAFMPVAYLKQGCPFSFKFLLFITEAGLLEKIKVEEVVEGEEHMEEVRRMLSEKLGSASFPCVELEEGKFMSDSDKLIQYFADKYGKNIESLEVVPFYTRGIFKKLGKLYAENKKYQEKYGEI